jgi:uncharacterized SAM-binding protein YcdF (DUF218 family)
MIFSFFGSLILISLAAWLLKRKLAAKVIFILSFGLIFTASLSPATQKIIDFTQSPSPVEDFKFDGQNVIVLLGGGSSFWSDTKNLHPQHMSFSRINKAFEVYRKCKQASQDVCHILVSGGDPSMRGMSESALMTAELMKLGADQEDILQEDRSRNTRENAFYSSDVILKNNYKSVILVTSGFHIRRAKAWFEHFKITSQIAPADTLMAIDTLKPSAQNLFYVDVALHEILGYLQFKWLVLF